MKLEQCYRFDIRDFENGRLVNALKQIKQKYGVTDETENMYGNRKKVRHIVSEWEDETTYCIKIYMQKTNSWKDSLKAKVPNLSRKDILLNRDMKRDINNSINKYRFDKEI